MTDAKEEPEEEMPDVAREGEPTFEAEEREVFRRALRSLNQAGVGYVMAGAFAKWAYTGIWRDTKDLDIFLKPEDLKTALDALAEAGFRTEVLFEHWLAKAHREPYFVDLIFGTGHGHLSIDDSWLENAKTMEFVGVDTPLIALEELIVSKMYVAERYRFDGADILHLIQGAKGEVNWKRVLGLLGPSWKLLLWHLLLFDYVYPGHSHYLPRELMVELFERVKEGWGQAKDAKAFRGTLLDPFSFVVDIEDWGYEDRRDLEPVVNEEGELR